MMGAAHFKLSVARLMNLYLCSGVDNPHGGNEAVEVNSNKNLLLIIIILIMVKKTSKISQGCSPTTRPLFKPFSTF
jgi:hypothetical protein